MTHTPGPWTLTETGAILDANLEIIADVDPELVRPEAQDRADGRLMATAPDLLAALERIAAIRISGDECGDWCPSDGSHADTELGEHSTSLDDLIEIQYEAVGVAREAIAAAKGETSG